MATEPRVIGTDLDNGAYIAQDVKVTATQTTIADTAGDFVSTTVEGALAELSARLSVVENGGGPGPTPITTTTTLTSSDMDNASVSGDTVTFTATVAPATTGTVTFKDGANTLGTGTLNGSSHAVYVTSALAVGTHSITATFAATSTHAASTSSAIVHTVASSGGGGSAPSAPRNVVATPVAAGVRINWQIPVDGVTTPGAPTEIASYNIERSLSPSSGFEIVATTPGPSATVRVSMPLLPGTTYYFRVKAAYMVNPTEFSPPSTVANAVPLAAPAMPASWEDAMATGDITAITLWYQANTGFDSEGFDEGDLWGPGADDIAYIDDTWLSENEGTNVVLSGGRWTVTALYAQSVTVARNNVTLTHCKADRPFAANQGGFDALPGIKGVIIDHCTADGNFGDSNHNAFGDGIGYFPNDHTADNIIVRWCEITAYRAGFLMFFGSTCQYNWVHDLYIFSDSHNTAHSIHGENCTIYRCLLTDGTSSCISLYADNTPFTKFYLIENILDTQGSAIFEVNFPQRPPTNYHILQDGYDRQMVGNRFAKGAAGDNQLFTKVSDNKLITGKRIFFDTGEPQVPHEPSLHQFKYYDYGNPVPYQDTYNFTPTPNSTLLVLAAPQNGGHGTPPAPVVTANGEHVSDQTFAKIAETDFDPTGDNYGMKLFLYKATTGPTTSFESIHIDYTGNGSAAYYGTFWVFEVSNTTGLTLVKYAPKIQHNPAFGGVDDSITSGPLSSAAANGNLCMAFAAGSGLTTDNEFGDVSGWEKIGVSSQIVNPGNAPGVVGATYWRKDFTGTQMTIGDLGNGVGIAGLLLCEFSGA